MNTWIGQIIEANQLLNKAGFQQRTDYRTIEDRNKASLKLMSIANIPKFTWTIDSESGDIIVKSEERPIGVHVWHANTCNSQRRDWRIANLDKPCSCGFDVPGEDLCSNMAVLWTSDPLEETEPGSLTWVAHKRPPLEGRYVAFYVSLSYNTTDGSKDWPLGSTGIMDFSTTVSVVPNTFPYADCEAEDCRGYLL